VSAVRLVLLRHGETQANRARLIQGQDDSPLTPEGVLGIGRLTEKLRALPVEAEAAHWYCSPLPRARETLRLVREGLGLAPDPGAPVRYDPRLMEIDFGAYTGRPVDDVLTLIQHHKRDPARAYPGGESGADLKARVLAFLEEVTNGGGGRQVLVMTHFGVIETALRHYLGIPVTQRVHPDHEEIHHIDLAPGAPPRVSRI